MAVYAYDARAAFMTDAGTCLIRAVCLTLCYTGKERDAESGNYYFGARYYASSMGRWMSPDYSLNGVIMELPQTWNKYSYEYNRPTYGTDPDGRCPPCIGAVIGGVVEGGFDLGKQLYKTGGSFSKEDGFSWGELGANMAGGVISGAIAGATGGASLIGTAGVASSEIIGDLAAGVTGSVVGGAVTRGLDPNSPSGDALSAGAVSTNALVGFVGGAGGHIAGDFVHVPGEPTFRMSGRGSNKKYNMAVQAITNRVRALNNQAIRSSAASGGVSLVNHFWDWFSSPPSPPCATTSATDGLGNSTGRPGCQ
jgi:RHS repeat-associated protein